MTRDRPAPEPEPDGPGAAADFARNPVLVRLWRGGHVESQHHGAWVLVDASGRVLEGAGEWQRPIFARSAVKALQALPLVETGAAAALGYSDQELALALASHNAELCHTELVLALLGRLGLGVEALRCGPQQPRDRAARALLDQRGEQPSGLHNNCSGKHVGFLVLARHMNVELERYLEPDCASQELVRRAVCEMSDTPAAELVTAIDGCSAPTFRLPLRGLATAFARVANPAALSSERGQACRWMQRVVARHPILIAGRRRRICTALASVSGGRLFPKIGAEGVYAVGVVGADRALAIKIDDGATRAVEAAVVHLLDRHGLLKPDEKAALAEYRADPLLNWAGLEVGRAEVLA